MPKPKYHHRVAVEATIVFEIPSDALEMSDRALHGAAQSELRKHADHIAEEAFNLSSLKGGVVYFDTSKIANVTLYDTFKAKEVLSR